MSSVIKFLIVALVSYLLGSLNFSIIVSKIFTKKDIRDYGSGNAGTTNSLRVMGAKLSILVIIGDVLKGIVAVKLSKYIVGADFSCVFAAEVTASIAAVLGHAFPIYYGFKGGKGVMTTAAVIGCLDWRVLLICLSVFLIILLISKYVSLGSIIAVWLVAPVFAAFYGFSDKGIAYFICGIIIAVIVTVLHRSNIKRLIAGKENKFSIKKQ